MKENNTIINSILILFCIIFCFILNVITVMLNYGYYQGMQINLNTLSFSMIVFEIIKLLVIYILLSLILGRKDSLIILLSSYYIYWLINLSYINDQLKSGEMWLIFLNIIYIVFIKYTMNSINKKLSVLYFVYVVIILISVINVIYPYYNSIYNIIFLLVINIISTICNIYYKIREKNLSNNKKNFLIIYYSEQCVLSLYLLSKML